MQQRNITLAKILTYCGTLPLVGCVLAFAMPQGGINSTLIAQTYSAIIISFLCGIHWAVHLFFCEKCPRNLLITSNIIALTAWLSLLSPTHRIAFLLQIFCFLYLLLIDAKIREAGILPDWFYILRRNATGIVVISLGITVALS
jgi:hypothetical protein